MAYKKLFNLPAIIFKLRVFIDKRKGLDFLQTIHSEKVGLNSEVSFHSSPSGNKYFDSEEKSFKQRNIFDTLRHTAFIFKISLLKLIMPLVIKIKKVIH
ncbi:MAG: hypothetical protein V3U87_03180 [Methylococcaceae bacterium]